MHRHLHLADYAYNGLGNPRIGGGVALLEALGDAKVIEFGNAADLLDRHGDAERHEAVTAISPRPVNAHTHLDLSGMPLTRGSYEGFITAVVSHGRSGGRGLASARRGVEELLSSGCRTVGDIVNSSDVMEYLLGEERLNGVAYWEVFAPDPVDAERKLRETEDLLRGFRRKERPGGVKVGLSPHTPHTVSAPLLKGLAALAREMALPVQIHVAESPGEIALHREGTGPLFDAFAELLPFWRPSGLTPVGYLAELGFLDIAPTLVHMVHVDEEDLKLVSRHGCPVVHCPRSNQLLRCGRFPWELHARHGITVALGTDSLGSSPSLSVAEELVAALGIHGERAGWQALLRAVVKGGHRALRLDPPKVLRGDSAASLVSWRLTASGSVRLEPVFGA